MVFLFIIRFVIIRFQQLFPENLSLLAGKYSEAHTCHPLSATRLSMYLVTEFVFSTRSLSLVAWTQSIVYRLGLIPMLPVFCDKLQNMRTVNAITGAPAWRDLKFGI